MVHKMIYKMKKVVDVADFCAIMFNVHVVKHCT